jgi:hypothetical protein
MGLDIYLSYYRDYNQSKANEKKYEIISEDIWNEVKEQEGEDLCEKTKKRVCDYLNKEAEKLGLCEWGEDITHRDRIELDSKLYPEHGFKIGYFRSSYNGSGINNLLRDLGIPDLYDIFCHDDDEYEFVPDWANALNVVQEAIVQLKKDKGYRVETISANMFSPDDVAKNPLEAMELFKKQLNEKKSKDFNWYSNKDGHFYMDNKGLEVHGLIPGKDFIDRPCTYVVFKVKDGNKYYLQALEIVKETIEYVLAQENPQAYYLRWSA